MLRLEYSVPYYMSLILKQLYILFQFIQLASMHIYESYFILKLIHTCHVVVLNGIFICYFLKIYQSKTILDSHLHFIYTFSNLCKQVLIG